MITPTFHWKVDQFGGHHLTADHVKGDLANVLVIVSLVPDKPIGCFVEHPGWTGEKYTLHSKWEEGYAAAESAVLPYVEKQLADFHSQLVNAAAQELHLMERTWRLFDDLAPGDQARYRDRGGRVVDAILPLIGGAA